MNPLQHFKFAQFEFVLRAREVLYLPPYKGSSLRGGFGHAFKKVVCIKKEKTCEDCLLREKCVYSYVFETPPPSHSEMMGKYPFVPHPFVITPPLEEKRKYHQGETLLFELTLIGKAIDFLPYFIYTFDELGKMGIGRGKGKYQLEEVRAMDIWEGKGENQGGEEKRKRVLIYSGGEKILRGNFNSISGEDLLPLSFTSSTLNLLFLTPTRLKYGERLTPQLEFHILVRNLLRRVSLLSYFHWEEELDFDFKGLIEDSKNVRVLRSDLKWYDWERYSNRQEVRMKMGGFIGPVVFEGDFSPFIPFLFLGEYVHVGKGTSFGLGKYKILNFES